MVSEELLQQNPARNMNADFVFQRILGDPTIQDADQWKDGSDCMMCQKHNHIQIEMNEF